MEVHLAYGHNGLAARVPDDAVVLAPTDLPALPDQAAAVRAAVEPHLHGVGRGQRVVVVFPDITRPMPNRTVLPPVLASLEDRGVRPDDVLLLCGTGTHRPATSDEMAELVGPDVVDRYDVRCHEATDGPHVDVGSVDGAPVLLDAAYVEAGARVVTGFVEPHFFAGFSGGPKGVCPGVAALGTVLEAHSPARIADPRSTWTVLDGNPVHDFVRAAAALCPPAVAVDVAINSSRRLTAVFAGPLPGAHRRACAFVERTAVQKVAGRFDVVVSTNAGHPLDRNLYQAVKGMAAAERVVRPGGTIVMAAACADGVPPEGDFGRLLAEATSPDDLVDANAPSAIDRWQAQVLGRVLQRARVLLRTDGLDDDAVRAAHLEPVPDLTEAVAAAVRDAGPDARVCVLPQGPLTVASPH